MCIAFLAQPGGQEGYAGHVTTLDNTNAVQQMAQSLPHHFAYMNVCLVMLCIVPPWPAHCSMLCHTLSNCPYPSQCCEATLGLEGAI